MTNTQFSLCNCMILYAMECAVCEQVSERRKREELAWLQREQELSELK